MVLQIWVTVLWQKDKRSHWKEKIALSFKSRDLPRSLTSLLPCLRDKYGREASYLEGKGRKTKGEALAHRPLVNHWTTGGTCILVPIRMLSTHPYWLVILTCWFWDQNVYSFSPFSFLQTPKPSLVLKPLCVLSVNTLMRVCVCVCAVQC